MNAENLKTKGFPVEVKNRDFKLPQDGFIQIVPLGEALIGQPEASEYLTGQKGVHATQVLDQEGIRQMAENFKGELLIDFEHFSDDPDKATTAAGWVQNVEARDDGLYAQVRWSKTGRESVEGGDYRFISSVFNTASFESLGGTRFRATELTGAGLTNKTQLKKLPTIKPISNKKGSITTNKNTMDYKLSLCSLLGLAASATDDQIRNRETAFQDEQRAKDAQLHELEQVKNREKELIEQLTEHDLEKYAPFIKNREEIKEALIKNREGTLAVLKNMKIEEKESSGAGPHAPSMPVYNRDAATPPDHVINKQNQLADQQVAKIQNRASELQELNQHWSLSQCYEQAEAELKNAK